MTLQFRQPLPAAHHANTAQRSLLSDSSAPVYRTVLKRLMDISLVLIGALPVLMVVAVLAVLIRRDGASPFYRQKRVGLGGEVFYMWKLRSMVVDAEAKLDAYLAANPEARAEWDRAQKLRNDPRITRIGAIIRKTSLDELPQLWNVLKGDMSFVGPRPMLESQQSLYPGSAYYALRPGITGFWQTSVRNEASFVERATYDAAYLRELSLVTDIKVLLRTVKVVAKGTGC